MNAYAEPPTDRPEGGEYEPVSGLDQQTVACVRACEAEAAAKTASDYAHVVWAYGVARRHSSTWKSPT